MTFQTDRLRFEAGAVNMFTSTQGIAPGKACIMHGVGFEVGRE
jgi:hypothetical protein